ncbi:hypothetical protein F4805DRAFT_449876 [Annulohypoxylon moriforme]|nr:hypothetical protein F4805DRAFT_449876 [Annulohypoxylon moriforme]
MCFTPTLIGIMSGFFSLLPDLLPMIMPSEVQITKASDLEAQRDGKDAAMIRQGAVIGKSDRMCASGKPPYQLISKPDSLCICLAFKHKRNVTKCRNESLPGLDRGVGSRLQMECP